MKQQYEGLPGQQRLEFVTNEMPSRENQVTINSSSEFLTHTQTCTDVTLVVCVGNRRSNASKLPFSFSSNSRDSHCKMTASFNAEIHDELLRVKLAITNCN